MGAMMLALRAGGSARVGMQSSLGFMLPFE